MVSLLKIWVRPLEYMSSPNSHLANISFVAMGLLLMSLFKWQHMEEPIM